MGSIVRNALSFTVFLLCALVSGSGSSIRAQEKTGKIVKESITSNTKKRTYYLFVPPAPKVPAPLIVLLHGSGRDGMSLEKWKDLANEQGFIIVGPDAESSSGWSAPKDGPGFLRDLVEALKAYPINARRVYLFAIPNNWHTIRPRIPKTRIMTARCGFTILLLAS